MTNDKTNYDFLQLGKQRAERIRGIALIILCTSNEGDLE